MPTRRNSFSKDQRLCSQKQLDELFASGNRSLTAFPLRVVFRQRAAQHPLSPVQVMMSVSKRHFKHAVDRNRAKRQLRESWRLNRDILLQTLPPDCHLDLAFLWLSSVPQPSAVVERKMRFLLHSLSEHLCAG